MLTISKNINTKWQFINIYIYDSEFQMETIAR